VGALCVVLTGIAEGHYILPAPKGATFFCFFISLTILFYLEGLMICLVAVQYYDRESFKESYPGAYVIHEIISQPEAMKKFIIGRQFFTVLDVFLLAQCCTFPEWPNDSMNDTLFWILIKSGLVGVFVVLTFGQLVPELLAAQYPLTFMNLPGSLFIVKASLFFDQCAVGHAAWLVYHGIKPYVFGNAMENEDIHEEKPEVLRPPMAELLAKTGSAYGDIPPSTIISTTA
jgi:hypothetical protein